MSAVQTLEVPGYQVMHLLGTGARSTIWQVRERQTGELFALKRAVKRQRSDYRFLEQALNEHEVASGLEHPVIRKMYRLRRVKHLLSLREVHLIMEYCRGNTLQSDRPESVAETVRIFLEVASALVYLNAQGYVHADMKPNNVIVAPTGEVKIIDFGQSCRIGTVKRRIQGTPDFIAPEQVRRQPLDARTDVFNFAAAIYWTLTGRPIPTILPSKDARTITNDLAVTPAEELNPLVPPPLSKLISDCIEVKPSRRPATMNAVVSRLVLVQHTLQRSAPDRKPGGSRDKT